MVGVGALVSLQSSASESTESVTSYTAEQIARYQALPETATISQLLPFVSSDDATVEASARQRIAQHPSQSQELADLLDASNPAAISYVAQIEENPPRELTPAWARLLERANSKL